MQQRKEKSRAQSTSAAEDAVGNNSDIYVPLEDAGDASDTEKYVDEIRQSPCAG